MIIPEIKKSILEGLDNLPYEKQKQVLNFVQVLVISSPVKNKDNTDPIEKVCGSLKGSNFIVKRYLEQKKEKYYYL